jgi:hypothetical protein
MPCKLHKALRWNKRDPFFECDESHNGEIKWKIIRSLSVKNKSESLEGVVHEGRMVTSASVTVENVKQPSIYDLSANGQKNIKRRQSIDSDASQICTKRIKGSISDTENYVSSESFVPVGSQWRNNSCAYDAILTILFNVWRENPERISRAWNELGNEHLDFLITAFESRIHYHMGMSFYNLEEIQDLMRHQFVRLDGEFAFGRYTSVHAVMNRLLISPFPVMKSLIMCPNNHEVDRDERSSNSCEIMTHAAPAHYSVQQYMDNFITPSSSVCHGCGETLIRSFSFIFHPPILAIELWGGLRALDIVLNIEASGSFCQYNLRGVIYFSCEHFTSRIITNNGMIWFHDGIFTGSRLIHEPTNISSVPVTDSILAIYVCDTYIV